MQVFKNQNESPSEILLMDVTGAASWIWVCQLVKALERLKESVAKKSRMYFMNLKTAYGRVHWWMKHKMSFIFYSGTDEING